MDKLVRKFKKDIEKEKSTSKDAMQILEEFLKIKAQEEREYEEEKIDSSGLTKPSKTKKEPA